MSGLTIHSKVMSLMRRVQPLPMLQEAKDFDMWNASLKQVFYSAGLLAFYLKAEEEKLSEDDKNKNDENLDKLQEKTNKLRGAYHCIIRQQLLPDGKN